MKEFEQQTIDYFNAKNTIEDYVRDLRLEIDNLISTGKSFSYQLPGNFKKEEMLNNFLSIYENITDEFIAHKFMGKEKDSYIKSLRSFLENQIPSPSLIEQYSETLDDIIEKKIFAGTYQHFTVTKGKKKLKQKKGNLNHDELLKLYNSWSRKGRKLHKYVKENVNQIYENIFRYQSLIYSENVGKLSDFYFGHSAKFLESCVEKLIYSSKDLMEILEIENKINRKTNLINERVDPNRFFKSRDYYESDKQTINKINDFTLKAGTAVENFFEFIREYLKIKEPQENKGDYSKLVNLINEIEKGKFKAPEKIGVHENEIIKKETIQDILPKQLKNAFSNNVIYKEFKQLRNACVHSTIFREYDDLVFINGIKLVHKKEKEIKMTPVVSYLQTMHKELSQYVVESLNLLLMPEKAPTDFIPVSKNGKETLAETKNEITFRQALKGFQSKSI